MWLVKIEMLEEGRYSGSIHCCGKLPGGLVRQAERSSKTRIPLSRAGAGQADTSEGSGKGQLLLWAWFLCFSPQNALLEEACVDAHLSSAGGQALPGALGAQLVLYPSAHSFLVSREIPNEALGAGIYCAAFTAPSLGSQRYL